MNYLSCEIRIGSAGIRQIGTEVLDLHQLVISLLFPSVCDYNRLGLTQASSINYRQCLYEPASISAVLDESLRPFASSATAIDLYLIDFTANSFVTVRDPLLLVIIDWIKLMCEKQRCAQFILLLPRLPGKDGATLEQLTNMSEMLPNSSYMIILIDASGETRTFASRLDTPLDIRGAEGAITERLRAIYGSPEAIMPSRLVRRLGHFQTRYPREGRTRCRAYSYYLHDCAIEMRYLLEKWWAANSEGCIGTLFDLENNPSFRNILRSFCDSHNLRAERIVDVCNRPELAKELSTQGPFAIVMDVLDSGETLRQYAADLSAFGIQLSRNVLVGINKSGNTNSRLGDYAIVGFVAALPEPESLRCEQCQIHLATSDDSEDPYLDIRSFDMLTMSFEKTWVQEPPNEVPEEVRYGYNLIPDFSTILSNHAHWLAYKIHRFLMEGNCPDDLFIIHPNEPDSSYIVDSLQTWYRDSLPVVRVPRTDITMVQHMNNQWEPILKQESERDWVRQLLSLGRAVALIIDVFNASGATVRSLVDLLKCVGVDPFSYFCFVDFMPTDNDTIAGIPKYALYKWYNPRKLK